MDKAQLLARTKSFAIRVVRMTRCLPRDVAGEVLGRQVIRSATSVGANYRSACRGRSRKEFAARLGVALEEADETGYWLGLISEVGLLPPKKLEPLATEAGELTAIFAAARKTLGNEKS